MPHPYLAIGRRAALAFVLVLAVAACSAVDLPRDDVARVAPGGFATFPGGAVVAAPEGALEAPIDAFANPVEDVEGAFPPGALPVGSAVRFGALEDVRAGAVPLAIGLPVPDGVQPERTAIAVQTLPVDAVGRYLSEPVWEVLTSALDAEGAVVLASVRGLAQAGRLAVVVVGDGLDTPRLPARPATAARVEPSQAVAFEATCTGFNGPHVAITNPSSIPCTAADETNLEAELAIAYADFTGVGFRAPALARSLSILESVASLQDGVVELVYGPYEARLLPYRPVAAGADTWGCGEQPGPNGIKNSGGYTVGSGSLFVCIDVAGFPGPQGAAADTARHEYFHATQFAYPAVANARSVDLWAIEGTAVASENSLATMVRDATRPARVIDVRLPSDSRLYEYEAQDFFVFAGQDLGRGLEYLRFVFQRGARTRDVDAALRDSLGFQDGLEEMYWRWVRHQAMNDSSVATSACGPEPVVDVPLTMTFTPNSPDGFAEGVLPSLTAHRHDLVFAADPAVQYEVDIRIVPDRTGVMRVRSYASGQDATGAVQCANIYDGASLNVFVPAGTANTEVSVLVANPEPDSILVHLRYRLEVRVRPTLVIEEPVETTDVRSAASPVTMRARFTTPDPRVAGLPIEWRAIYFSAGQPTLYWDFESASGETLAFRAQDPYCDGGLMLDAFVDLSSVADEYANSSDSRTVRLQGLDAGDLRAVIVAPSRPVQHLEIDPTANQVPPYVLRGYASQRRCGADGLPGATASWRDGLNAVWVQGTAPLVFEVDDGDFTDGAGGWRSLLAMLVVEAAGEVDASTVLLVPCAGRDGDAVPERPGVPACPAAIDGFWYDLDEAFETLSTLPTWQELDFALNGRAADLERALNLVSGSFPADPATTLPLLDVAVPVRDHLATLVDRLAAATVPDTAFAALDELDARVRGDEALVGVDADLYWVASGHVRAALVAYDRADPYWDPDGGLPAEGDAWARFAFVRHVDAALVEADAVAPARSALAGLLTTATRRAIGEPVHLRAATLGALLGARDALQDVGYGER